MSRSADLVFDLIARHRIDCDPVRSGWVQVAYSERWPACMLVRAVGRGAACHRTRLDRDDVAPRLGTEAFAGGWLDGRAGGIHPLAYARGLVQAAQSAGARVHGGTEVTALERRGARWHASTSTGAIVTPSTW